VAAAARSVELVGLESGGTVLMDEHMFVLWADGGAGRFPVESTTSRGVAQSGSAPGWGPGGRRFESCLPDYVSKAAETRKAKRRLAKSCSQRLAVVVIATPPTTVTWSPA
jgi:hypothetical protein